MKRYWDYSESERAALTGEQVETLLTYELMEQGVLQVEPLKLEEIQPVALPTRRVFMLSEVNSYGAQSSLGLAFDTIEQAEACRSAIRYIREAGWQETPRTRNVRALQIVTEDLPTDEAVTASKVALAEQRRREEANAKATREHEEAGKKITDATSGIWSDWRDCREAEARRQRIRDTLTEYRRMTDGNEDVARAFLAKAFRADEIEEAIGPQPTAVACEAQA